MDDFVARSDRIYRLILNVYPRAFRDEYGEEMAQTMRDQVRDAWTERRVVGVIVLWLKVLLDTARSAFTEHLKHGWRVSFNRRGLGFGLATAIGFPLAFVSFGSRQFWSAVVWAGETIGFQTSNRWLHPAVAGPGFVLAGIGLYGLYKRLEINTITSKTLTIGAVGLGATLGLLGLAGIYIPTYKGQIPDGEVVDQLGAAGSDQLLSVSGVYGVPAGFVLLTFGLAVMGVIALRKKAFGALSFVPLVVVASGGLWFFVIVTRFLLLPLGMFRNTLETSALLIHVALWFILGALLWADPPGNAHPVPAA